MPSDRGLGLMESCKLTRDIGTQTSGESDLPRFGALDELRKRPGLHLRRGQSAVLPMKMISLTLMMILLSLHPRGSDLMLSRQPPQLPKLRLPRRLLRRKHRLPPPFPKEKMLLLLPQLLLLIYEV
nr:uncharacterized protein LOC127338097 [Lolium perenne]